MPSNTGRAHAPEDLAGDDDGVHQHGQAGLREHDICGRAGGVGGALHGDAHVRALQGGRVVDAVAGHAHGEALLAQRLHDDELVLGEHLQRYRGVCVGGRAASAPEAGASAGHQRQPG
jgi:hypothetical protein